MPYRFQTCWRVRFDEVDLQGVVHHPKIVTYLEIGRVEYWRELGTTYRAMRESGYEFIVKAIQVEYIKPLLFDETITVGVGIKSMGRANFTLGYEIRKEDGSLAVEAETQLVCSKVGSGKPSALPDGFAESIRKYEEK